VGVVGGWLGRWWVLEFFREGWLCLWGWVGGVFWWCWCGGGVGAVWGCGVLWV